MKASVPSIDNVGPLYRVDPKYGVISQNDYYSLRGFKYGIVKPLGSGAFGDVYLVTRTFVGKKHRPRSAFIASFGEEPQFYVAKDIMYSKYLSEEELAALGIDEYSTAVPALSALPPAMLQESRLMQQLPHPFIVPIYEVLPSASSLTLVMRYCPGGDLSRHIKQRAAAIEQVKEALRTARAQRALAAVAAALPADAPSLPEFLFSHLFIPLPVVLCWLSQLLLALAHLHRHSVAHRDIKTHNIFLAEEYPVPCLRALVLRYGREYGVNITAILSLFPATGVCACTSSLSRASSSPVGGSGRGSRKGSESDGSGLGGLGTDADPRAPTPSDARNHALVDARQQPSPVAADPLFADIAAITASTALEDSLDEPFDDDDGEDDGAFNKASSVATTASFASSSALTFTLSQPRTTANNTATTAFSLPLPETDADVPLSPPASRPHTPGPPPCVAYQPFPPPHVLLGDLGVARARPSRSSEGEGLVGSPQYLPPEACAGRSVGAAGDVWGLGCVLYECLALRVCFAGTNIAGVVGRILRGAWSVAWSEAPLEGDAEGEGHVLTAAATVLATEAAVVAAKGPRGPLTSASGLDGGAVVSLEGLQALARGGLSRRAREAREREEHKERERAQAHAHASADADMYWGVGDAAEAVEDSVGGKERECVSVLCPVAAVGPNVAGAGTGVDAAGEWFWPVYPRWVRTLVAALLTVDERRRPNCGVVSEREGVRAWVAAVMAGLRERESEGVQWRRVRDRVEMGVATGESGGAGEEPGAGAGSMTEREREREREKSDEEERREWEAQRQREKRVRARARAQAMARAKEAKVKESKEREAREEKECEARAVEERRRERRERERGSLATDTAAGNQGDRGSVATHLPRGPSRARVGARAGEAAGNATGMGGHVGARADARSSAAGLPPLNSPPPSLSSQPRTLPTRTPSQLAPSAQHTRAGAPPARAHPPTPSALPPLRSPQVRAPPARPTPQQQPRSLQDLHTPLPQLPQQLPPRSRTPARTPVPTSASGTSAAASSTPAPTKLGALPPLAGASPAPTRGLAGARLPTTTSAPAPRASADPELSSSPSRPLLPPVRGPSRRDRAPQPPVPAPTPTAAAAAPAGAATGDSAGERRDAARGGRGNAAFSLRPMPPSATRSASAVAPSLSWLAAQEQACWQELRQMDAGTRAQSRAAGRRPASVHRSAVHGPATEDAGSSLSSDTAAPAVGPSPRGLSGLTARLRAVVQLSLAQGQHPPVAEPPTATPSIDSRRTSGASAAAAPPNRPVSAGGAVEDESENAFGGTVMLSFADAMRKMRASAAMSSSAPTDVSPPRSRLPHTRSDASSPSPAARMRAPAAGAREGLRDDLGRSPPRKPRAPQASLSSPTAAGASPTPAPRAVRPVLNARARGGGGGSGSGGEGNNSSTVDANSPSPARNAARTRSSAVAGPVGEPTADSIVQQLIGSEVSAADKAREYKRRHRAEKAAKEEAERAKAEEHRQRVKEGRKRGSDFRDFLKEKREEMKLSGVEDVPVKVLI